MQFINWSSLIASCPGHFMYFRIFHLNDIFMWLWKSLNLARNHAEQIIHMHRIHSGNNPLIFTILHCRISPMLKLRIGIFSTVLLWAIWPFSFIPSSNHIILLPLWEIWVQYLWICRDHFLWLLQGWIRNVWRKLIWKNAFCKKIFPSFFSLVLDINISNLYLQAPPQQNQ